MIIQTENSFRFCQPDVSLDLLTSVGVHVIIALEGRYMLEVSHGNSKDHTHTISEMMTCSSTTASFMPAKSNGSMSGSHVGIGVALGLSVS